MLAEAARHQVDIEAKLNVLQLQNEAAVVSRAAEVYQAATEREDKHGLDSVDENRAQPTKEYVERTREYVQKTPVQYASQPFPKSQHMHREPKLLLCPQTLYVLTRYLTRQTSPRT